MFIYENHSNCARNASPARKPARVCYHEIRIWRYEKEHTRYRTGLHVLVQRWMQRTSSCPCSRLSARRTLLRASPRVHLAFLVRRPFFCSAEMRTACKMRLQRTLMNASSAHTCFRTPLVSGPAKRLPARSQSRSADRNPERVCIAE